MSPGVSDMSPPRAEPASLRYVCLQVGPALPGVGDVQSSSEPSIRDLPISRSFPVSAVSQWRSSNAGR
ncbi:hypothetical protein AAFF_G00105000 [Aldrovandia affinis]|uniref:Uncharacterized protein n=1 Tax=Aldrovandia affinis TaxID=143900 RepID=A0AAD7WXT4_9TELE|nr:hypothetical protein AAFF_G00105000 [Aldrovandia affinis]